MLDQLKEDGKAVIAVGKIKDIFAGQGITEAVYTSGKTIVTLLVLGISTILNAIYFMKTVIRIYTPEKTEYETIYCKQQKEYTITIILFILLNLVLGLGSQPITDWIHSGLSMFS